MDVTRTTLTIEGARYGDAVEYTGGEVYHLFEAAYDALTIASPGLVFSDEVSSTALVFNINGAGGDPLTVIGCWFGDQFLTTAWLNFFAMTNLSLIGNFISGSDHVLDVKLAVIGLSLETIFSVRSRHSRFAQKEITTPRAPMASSSRVTLAADGTDSWTYLL